MRTVVRIKRGIAPQAATFPSKTLLRVYSSVEEELENNIMGKAAAQTRVGDVEFVCIFENMQVLSLRNIVEVSASIATLRAEEIIEFCFVHDPNVQRIHCLNLGGIAVGRLRDSARNAHWSHCLGIHLDLSSLSIKMTCDLLLAVCCACGQNVGAERETKRHATQRFGSIWALWRLLRTGTKISLAFLVLTLCSSALVGLRRASPLAASKRAPPHNKKKKKSTTTSR